jgi:hypothetical protein
MASTHSIRARIIGVFLPIFTVAFIGVPLVISGGVMLATIDVLFLPA